MLRLKYLIPLLIFLFVCVFLFVGLYLDPRKVPSALIDLLGKVYLLNVWASWCEACRYEHPYFIQLKNEGVKTTMVGYNYRDKPAQAARWLQVLGNPYDVILVDASGKAAIDFGVYGAPETFVIDKKGVIRYKVIGPMTEEVWKKDVKPIVDMLEKQ